MAVVAALTVGVIGGLGLVSGGAASALSSVVPGGGPTIYLNTHGAPTRCSLTLKWYGPGPLGPETWLGQWDKYWESCDGTLETPPLDPGVTKVVVTAHDGYSGDTSETSFKDINVPLDNNVAVCFLAKANNSVVYTGWDYKGGKCNGD
jgi:hypothetical protein